jgi:hypothetical protein
MATFFIKTNNEGAYNRIMETLVSKGLTHSKTKVFGTDEIEIIGSAEDFKFFMNQISEINSAVGETVALISEGV